VKCLLAMAAIALSMTTAAQAANHTIMFAGNYWRVTHIARNTGGIPMCSMQSQISLPNNAVGYVMIKWSTQFPHPSLQLSKTNWRFPSDMQVPFSIDLDNGRRQFVGVSRVNTNIKNTFIEVAIGADEGNGSWLDDFASSGTMTIKFSGNEPQWTVKMAGSRDAAKSFRSCLNRLNENGPPDERPTSPVPDVPDTSSQFGTPKPVPTVPIRKPKGDSI
jgi:hypothetical protein